MSNEYDFAAMAEMLGITLTKEQIEASKEAAKKVPFLKIVNEECAAKFSNTDSSDALAFVEELVKVAEQMTTVVTPNVLDKSGASKHQIAFKFPGLGKVGIYVTTETD